MESYVCNYYSSIQSSDITLSKFENGNRENGIHKFILTRFLFCSIILKMRRQYISMNTNTLYNSVPSDIRPLNNNCFRLILSSVDKMVYAHIGILRSTRVHLQYAAQMKVPLCEQILRQKLCTKVEDTSLAMPDSLRDFTWQGAHPN